jgi:hypothetical protein
VQKVAPFLTPENRLQVLRDLQSGGNSGPVFDKASGAALPATTEQLSHNTSAKTDCADKSCLWAFSYNFLDTIKTRERKYGKPAFSYDDGGGKSGVTEKLTQVRPDFTFASYEVEELNSLLDKHGLTGSMGGAKITEADFARLMKVNGIIDGIRPADKPSFGLSMSGLKSAEGQTASLANFALLRHEIRLCRKAVFGRR